MSVSGVSAAGAAHSQSPLSALISKVAGAAGGADADGDHDGSGKAGATATPAPAAASAAKPVPGSTVTRYA